jgi:phage shock protein C
MTTAPESVRDEETPRAEQPRRLYRSTNDRVLAGICGGLGEYFAVDPVWFRIGFVVLTLGGGAGILAYLIMWLIVQPQPDGHVPTAPAERGTVSGAAILGVMLMIAGSIALVNTVAPWMGQYVWPVVLVMGGLALVIGGLNHDNRR